ncbi:MAG: Nif3-like dinuclear metal center hexameric protein [Armatimonadota bacterium]
MRVSDVIDEIEAVAPPQSAMGWDNVGLQLGAADERCDGVLVTLEVTPEVADEAALVGANLIVSHHPLIFTPLSALRTDRPLGALLRRLLEDNTAVYAAHTNLDAAPDVGTAAALAEALGLDDFAPLVEEGEVGLGAVGNVDGGLPVDAIIGRIRRSLSPEHLTVVGETDCVVNRLALMPGSGGDAVGPAAAAGADLLVCGDLKHHDALDALALGLTVIDATHYATERPVVAMLADYLRGRLPHDLRVLASDVVTDPFVGATRRG